MDLGDTNKKPKETKVRTMAHSRRQKENDTFAEIAQTLPTQEHTKDLDKASILRVTINFIRLRNFIAESKEEVDEPELDDEGELFNEGADPTPEVPKEPSISDVLPNFSKDVLQALDGFMMVFASDGRVLFTSETIAHYLGLRQVDVIGVNVSDILHPQDCAELAKVFQTQGNDRDQVFDEKDPHRRKFLVRMRCAFTPSVRSITRCSNFKPVYCSCYLRFAQSGPSKGQFIGLVAMCKLANTNRIKEMVVGTFFKSKHGLDLSYTSLDRRIYWILGYDPSEMVGLKAYQYFHPEDLTATSSCHMNLLSRGQSHSPCYRIMSRWGDWMWVRSKSHMIYNQRSQLPEGIVIYTWIVRVDEEDDRMVAIKSGESGEDKIKKYDPFEKNVTSNDGSLDISSLVPTTTTVETTPILTPKVEPLVLQASPSFTGPVKQDLSPPYGGATPSNGVTTPPNGVTTPPDSAFYDQSPHVNPFTIPSPPNSLSSCRGSPERQTTVGPLIGDTSLNADSPYLQSYKMSPPYTPYADQTEPAYPTYHSPPVQMNEPAPLKFKLEHALSPDSSLESVSFASCPLPQTSMPPTGYPQYRDTATNCEINKMSAAAFPPDSFGMELQNPPHFTGIMYTSDQPMGFETMGAPTGQKQTFVNDARLRYAGAMPGVIGGHMTGHLHGNSSEESEHISQWSQWLKGTAPPPVC